MAETDAAFELRRAADTLERLAKAATPGPWKWDDLYMTIRGESESAVSGEDCGCGGGISSELDGAFMAAMSPDRALLLADTLRILEDPTLEALLKVEHNLRELARLVNGETGDGA